MEAAFPFRRPLQLCLVCMDSLFVGLISTRADMRSRHSAPIGMMIELFSLLSCILPADNKLPSYEDAEIRIHQVHGEYVRVVDVCPGMANGI